MEILIILQYLIFKKMKKIFYFIYLLPILTFGQSQTWSGSIVIDNMVNQDTVIQAPLSIIKDIDGRSWSFTVSVDTVAPIDTCVIIDIGGSNKRIVGSSRFAFNGYLSDYLPYTICMDSIITVTNNDTTYQKTFIGGDVLYPFARPQLYLNKDSSTSGTIYYNFLFSKP